MTNSEEQQYLSLLEECLASTSMEREDRTGVGTHGIYGAMMKFDLTGGKIPLLTTKRTYWKGVLHELLWFIDGETDSYILEDEGVTIWSGNTSREFLDGRGLEHVPDGDIGPGYGFQWRNFNGDYDLWMTDGIRTGTDQLKNIVDGLRENPNSRRHVLTAWNPLQIDEMCLPPCHVMSTFTILEGKLHATVTCRSQDILLGTPFNIASYGLMVHLLANDLNVEPGSLTWFGADVHLYDNHIDQAKEQISRVPYDFPTVKITSKKSIFEISPDDVELIGYQSHPAIKAPMAI